MLLQWVILEPQGPSSTLAAVRFSAPVRVRSLRIFPTGARPFKLQPDIVAVTEPNSLYLDVYFNSQPVNTDGKNKPKQSNALVSTSIAYQGGQVSFTVDSVTSEFATRLMIIRGKFEKLSLAIYGDIVSESPTPATEYTPKQLPQISHSSLPPALDPANSVDPTELARSLLTLVPILDRPNLALIIRLMFCLKPSNEDWEEKDFPHLYSNLEQGLDDLNLEKAVEMTSRPVSDSIDEEIVRTFARKLGDSVEEYNDDQAYFLAKLLSQCAPQHPLLVRYIVENIDLVQMYTLPNLDRPTLLYLLDAAASLDVSRQLNHHQTLDALVHIRDNSSYDDGARRAASRLYNRVKGWEVLEDSLLNTQSLFDAAAQLVKEIGAEENSFGIWLENMISNRDILDRLLETPPSQPLLYPPVMWQGAQVVSHDDFIVFLRAAVGVAAVVAVYAWADSVPVEGCRERTLAVLRLWQNVNGYREIVNHFMLMRQLAYRLECMLPLDDDLPSQAGIDAEHILKTLALQPCSMLRADFVKVMQNLQVPLNFITDSEVADFKRASALAKEGISGAIGLLTMSPEQLEAAQKRLDIRIAAAVVSDVLQKDANGEKELLETMWDDGHSGLPVYLIAHLASTSMELKMQFGLAVPLRKAQSEVAGIIQTCCDILRLLALLLATYPPPNRDFVSLTKSIADIFVCTDSADMIYAQESTVCAAAHAGRQLCTEILAALVVPRVLNVQTSAVSATVLKTLLTHASVPEAHDAAHHMTQVFWLIDHALPLPHSSTWGPDSEEGQQSWVRQVFPNVLPELRTFYALQEVDNKLHIVRRFKGLDDGNIGIADWLLLEEQRILQKAIAYVRSSPFESLEQRIAFWRVTTSGIVLSTLVQNTAESAHWAIGALLQEENSLILQSSLSELLETDFNFEPIGDLAAALSLHVSGADRYLQTVIMCTLLRAARCGRYNAITALLGLLRDSDGSLFDEKAAQEFGEAVERIIQDKGKLPTDFADTVFSVLEEVTPLNKSSGIFVFRGLTEKACSELVRWLNEALPIAKKTKLEALKLRWTFAGKARAPPISIPSSYALDFSLENWDALLTPPIPVPSTPTRRSPAQSAEMLGMITVSPPNALLRSPEVKGLTKTYLNNDFRNLRQLSTARQNTSRLPSRHVDDFEQGPSNIAPLNLNMTSSPPPLAFTAPHPHQPLPLPINPNLPMNPTFYQ